jgi:hypothetical protein
MILWVCLFPSQFKHLPPAPENCSEWKCVDEASENPCEIKFLKTCYQKLPTCSNMKNYPLKPQGFEVG